MQINVNGKSCQIKATTIFDALDELGYADAKIATAVNETFIPEAHRTTHTLCAGDRLEILAPMQGG